MYYASSGTVQNQQPAQLNYIFILKGQLNQQQIKMAHYKSVNKCFCIPILQKLAHIVTGSNKHECWACYIILRYMKTKQSSIESAIINTNLETVIEQMTIINVSQNDIEKYLDKKYIHNY